MTSNSKIMSVASLLALLAVAPLAHAQTPDGKDAIASMTVLTEVCLPLLQGAPMDSVVKAAGLKKSRDGWGLTIAGQRRIEIDTPGGSNPHNCSATIIHDPAASDGILSALSDWAGKQTPPLQQIKKQEKATGALYLLTTSSWVGQTAKGDLALAYSEDKTLNGQPVAGALDQAYMTVSLTPAAQ